MPSEMGVGKGFIQEHLHIPLKQINNAMLEARKINETLGRDVF